LGYLSKLNVPDFWKTRNAKCQENVNKSVNISGTSAPVYDAPRYSIRPGKEKANQGRKKSRGEREAAKIEGLTTGFWGTNATGYIQRDVITDNVTYWRSDWAAGCVAWNQSDWTSGELVG